VALTVEEIEPVVVSWSHSVCGGNVIEIEGAGLGNVDTTQITHLLVVEVQKHIIISEHVEDLTSLVRETSVNGHAKTEIVVLVIFSQILVRTLGDIPTLSVHHEVKQVSVRVHPRGGRRVGKSQVDGHVDGVGRVVEPSEERRLVVDGSIGR
jgi:hypothetical protein